VFFGSLCFGTFGLGCWQTRRYFEKVDKIHARELELSTGPPVPLRGDVRPKVGTKIWISGAFRHSDEILIGPRGAPKSAAYKKGRKAQGMASNPQGYFVVTPLERDDGKGTVLVKRGWVPYSYVQKNVPWERPKEIVSVTAVVDQFETPKRFSPVNHPEKRKLIWFDQMAAENGSGTHGLDPIYLTEVMDDVGENELKASTKKQQRSAFSARQAPKFPIKSTVDGFKEVTITPEIHMSYAITWFGLSAAGVMMTKKLMLRGRG